MSSACINHLLEVMNGPESQISYNVQSALHRHSVQKHVLKATDKGTKCDRVADVKYTSSSRPIRSVKPAEESFANIASGICINTTQVSFVAALLCTHPGAKILRAHLWCVQASHLPQVMIEIV